jgi:hypothetical protein
MSNAPFPSVVLRTTWLWLCLCTAFIMGSTPLQAAVLSSVQSDVVAADIDGDGWAASDANLGAPWTSVLIDMNGDVWGSGLPFSGWGVGFSGIPTLGQPGLFDDHIAESADLVANLTLINADVITFQFYQESLAYSPNALSVYFQDFQFDDWYRNITPPTSTGWTTYSVPLTTSAGWYSPTGGTDFALAMGGGTTQQMGVRLQYQAGSSQTQRYGIADYQVLGNQEVNVSAVPEPATVSLLLCAALLLRGIVDKKRFRVAHS